jgi:hypothetical protein
MSLRTGAEIITFLQLINKVSGLYGLLALLTGAHLSGLQLSMYLYSSVVFVATLCLCRHIRLQSPFQNLLLAHIYAIDAVVNALYTAFFGVAWFYVLAHPDDGDAAPGAGGISNSAGFTSPKYNVSKVDVVAEPVGGVKPGQNAVAMGTPSDSTGAGIGNAVFQTDSIMSIAMIAGFWALRVYLVFVMLAFARQCLRQHIAANASSAAWYDSNNSSTPAGALAENPFDAGKEDGAGWKGKLGRTMLRGAPLYWLGADAGEEWMRNIGGKFNRKSNAISLETQGVNERERRRRSGTGPPAPPRELRIPQLASLEEVR